MTKLLITGGAGYIGAVLTPVLLGKGYRVTVLDNMAHRQLSLLDCFSHSAFKFINGDIRDKGLLKKIMPECDLIIHLAAIVGAPACESARHLAAEVNFNASRHLNVLRSSNQPVIYASTGSVYGDLQDTCNEGCRINPISHYAATKADAENALMDSGNAISLRLSTAFGLSPRLRLDLLINDFVFQAVKNHCLVLYEGRHRRSFLHVKDIARAFVHAIEHYSEMRDNVYNTGDSSMNCTKEQVAEMIRREVDFELFHSRSRKDPDRRDYHVCFDKIKKTGFSCTIDIDRGIKELIAGFKMIRIRQPYCNAQ